MVIPTGRNALVRRVIRNLSRQQGVELEVILVHTKPHGELDGWLKRQSLNIKQVDCFGFANQHEARKVGLRLATNEFCHILDDDDFPTPNWYATADLSGDLYFTVPLAWLDDKGYILMRPRERFFKANPSSCIYRTQWLHETLSRMPSDLTANCEPFLYNLAYCHEHSPVIKASEYGINRGCFGGSDWGNREHYPVDHVAYWKRYLALGKPTIELPFLMDEYFEQYLQADLVWRTETT